MPELPVGERILAADVGGTHLNLGLLEPSGGGFRMVRKARFSTREEGALLPPILRFLEEAPGPWPARACLAGAGPVTGQRLHLTHGGWDLDGPALQAALGMPVKVVNDFVALAAGTVHLDRSDPAQVTTLVHGDGDRPPVDPEGLVLVAGAGTGFGAGFLVPGPGGARALPSEGGHLGLPIRDGEGRELWEHLARELGRPPEAESAVSGPGLVRLLAFLLATGRAGWTPACQAILSLPEPERPAALAACVDRDPGCDRAAALFVDLFAQICAELCAAFLPTGGLFLAGGIAARHPDWFLRDGRFMGRFEGTGRPHLQALARATPVHLVHDYDLSLYGAACAWAMP